MTMLVEVVARVECYIKSEEINDEKNTCDSKECTSEVDGLIRNQYTSSSRDRGTFK